MAGGGDIETKRKKGSNHTDRLQMAAQRERNLRKLNIPLFTKSSRVQIHTHTNTHTHPAWFGAKLGS